MQHFLQVESNWVRQLWAHFRDLPPTRGGGRQLLARGRGEVGGGGKEGRDSEGKHQWLYTRAAGRVWEAEGLLVLEGPGDWMEGRRGGAGQPLRVCLSHRGTELPGLWGSDRTRKTPRGSLRDPAGELRGNTGCLKVFLRKARTFPSLTSPQPSLLRTHGKFGGIFSSPACGTKAFQELMLHDILPGQDRGGWR